MVTEGLGYDSESPCFYSHWFVRVHILFFLQVKTKAWKQCDYRVFPTLPTAIELFVFHFIPLFHSGWYAHKINILPGASMYFLFLYLFDIGVSGKSLGLDFHLSRQFHFFLGTVQSLQPTPHNTNMHHTGASMTAIITILDYLVPAHVPDTTAGTLVKILYLPNVLQLV